MKGPKALWRKWHYSLISMHWNCKNWKHVGANSGSKSARIAKLWQFLQRHPKAAFSEKVQRGDQRKFFKNRQKRCPRWKGPKAHCANSIILFLVCAKSAKTGEDLGASSGSKRTRKAKLWQFWEGHPKPPFSENVQRGDQEKFFKNRPKSSLRFKRPTALSRKCHYPLNCIHVKCKNWTRVWHKKELQNVPNDQVMAIFATSPKTRIF